MIKLKLAKTKKPMVGDAYINITLVSNSPCKPNYSLGQLRVIDRCGLTTEHMTCVTMIGLYTRSGWDVPGIILGS